MSYAKSNHKKSDFTMNASQWAMFTFYEPMDKCCYACYECKNIQPPKYACGYFEFAKFCKPLFPLKMKIDMPYNKTHKRKCHDNMENYREYATT